MTTKISARPKPHKSVEKSINLAFDIIATIRKSGAMQAVALSALRAAIAHIEQIMGGERV